MCITSKKEGNKRDTLNRFAMKIIAYGLLFYGLFLCRICCADPATDPLAASVKPQVQALFGAGSTVAYCIYIAEIVLGSVVYVKTKNLLTLLGVPILMLFTRAMFTYIGS